ncbi:MAG: hypothetical protein KGJ19_06145, partial [Betaproteobacteria bacterium]|nr:hypothetical protein [Betaproteobacteria bacterium]
IHTHFKALGSVASSERAAFIFLSGAFFCTFLMFSATKFQLDYYIDIIFPFAAILCARFLNNSDVSRPLFIAQMCLIFLLALITIALSIYVNNFILLATVAIFLVGSSYYFYATRAASLKLRTIIYSVLAIDLLYIFLALLTTLAFTQYSVAHNAAKLLGRQSGMPVYIYQMPGVARELALYSKAPCYAIDTVESLTQPKGNFYLLVKHDQAQQLHLDPAQFMQFASMELVVHKTGTFKRLLRLAKGNWPLETIDFLQYSAP